jgi:hypothetical protein
MDVNLNLNSRSANRILARQALLFSLFEAYSNRDGFALAMVCSCNVYRYKNHYFLPVGSVLI